MIQLRMLRLQPSAASTQSVLGLLVGWCSRHLGILLLLGLVILLVRYCLNRRRFHVKKEGDTLCTPPTVPYIFPLLGSFPISYLWSPVEVVLDQSYIFQTANPVRVRSLNHDFYVVQGTDNVKALFKNSSLSTNITFLKFALRYTFGLPADPLSLYEKDNSGSGHVPHPDSKVAPRNRIDYIEHQNSARLLEGKGLPPLWGRFSGNIAGRFRDLYRDLGTLNLTCADLMRFVGDETTTATVNALCGPHLLRLSPGFVDDFWNFDRNLQTYSQGIPRVLAPRAYIIRDRCIHALKTWQEHARKNFTDSAIGSDGDDEFWGSRSFRERNAMCAEMDGFAPEHTAHSNLSFLWATKNSTAAASWNVYEIFRDPELLAAVRREIDPCVLNQCEGQVEFDMDLLLRLPLLQAVYAETLRLRMHFFLVRMPDKHSMNINNWIVPRGKVIVTSTTAAHKDSNAWMTGPGDEQHPIETFWPGRFLKTETKSHVLNKPTPGSNPKGHTTTFSTKERDGSWIPYGGGPRQCPGRHFAKRQIMFTTALMVTLFDCEIGESDRNVKEDVSASTFGGGVSNTARPVPFRLMRRKMDEPLAPFRPKRSKIACK